MTLAGAIVSPLAASAAVYDGDTVYIGGKQGYGGTGAFTIYEETPADPGAPGEPDLWAYCIEHDIPALTRVHGTVGELGSFLGENLFTDPVVQGKVLWVLAHSYPAVSLEELGAAAGAPGIALNDAVEATQYAIWRYTDVGYDTNWPWENADSEAAYHYLADGAEANAGLDPAELATAVSISSPGGAQEAGSLIGPFVVSTNRATVRVTVDPATVVTDAGGVPVDVNAVVDGQALYLDARGATTAGRATITATAAGSSANGHVISVPTTPGATPTAADHAQSIILVAPAGATTTADALAEWAGPAPAPAIGTTLVDAADGDQVLPAGGGRLVDTVEYEHLIPGVPYTLEGELMRKSDGSATGLVGSASFTPTAPNGSVEVAFTVPAGYAGQQLVAFETLFQAEVSAPVAVHHDLDAVSQTVTVEAAKPSTVTPPSRGGQQLAETGAAPAGALIAALAMAAAGAGLLLVRRRRA
ncbi:VaFE repeat-containing surface-anchored protein [Agromyces mediolanus]|uniref:VaFE repeat-containing surface-anchored protein n=1 Tax=Agromyces mediolanus TaxID=41986 RepID=UPI00383542CB